MKDFVEVLAPVHKLTNDLQLKHVPLSGFYMEWLQTIRSVESNKNNPLCSSLSQAFKNRLKKNFKRTMFYVSLFCLILGSIFLGQQTKKSVQVDFQTCKEYI